MLCGSWSYPQVDKEKILDQYNNKNIDMAKLLPDFRDTQEDSTSCTVIVAAAHASSECYSSFISALATRYTLHVGHFMAYQRMIIKAHRSFIGESRTTYDSFYRMKAANIKSLG